MERVDCVWAFVVREGTGFETAGFLDPAVQNLQITEQTIHVKRLLALSLASNAISSSESLRFSASVDLRSCRLSSRDLFSTFSRSSISCSLTRTTVNWFCRSS